MIIVEFHDKEIIIMALKVLYQTKEAAENGNQRKYKETLYGKESQVDALIATLTIGTTTKEGCYLASWNKSQYGADMYQIECEYTETKDWGTYSNVPSTVVGRKSAQLSVRNIQFPLEHLDNYLFNWNNYLIQLCNSADDVSTPLWWDTLGKDASGHLQGIPQQDEDDYRLVKSLSEIPTGRDADGKKWYIVEYPTKPGVEVYDWAVFVVTESARYRSANSAGSAIDKNINTIVAPSNTFGLSWGNWKMDEASVSYDGKAWIATCVYTHSGDENGWDQDIYD